MTFVRSGLIARCFAFLLTVLPISFLAPPLSSAQSAPAAQVGSDSASQLKGQSNQQAYSLPPDKLAKAIALSRVRNILDIVGSVWGLVVLWLLLATGAAAGLETWVQRVFRQRWLQGLAFFAIFMPETKQSGSEPTRRVGAARPRAA